MPQTDGYIRSITNTTLRGVYTPSVVDPDDTLRAADIKRASNDAITTLNFGVGSGYVDRSCVKDIAIPAGSSVTLDLYTGTDLPALQEEAAPLRRVKFLKVAVLSGGDTSGVRIGGAASDEWVGYFAAAGDKFDIFPGGPPFSVGSPAGKDVGATTKNFKMENLGAAEVVLRVSAGGSVVAPGAWTGFFGLLTYA